MSEPRLRVAVIGTGRWGKNLVRVFGSLEQAELVSVCDIDTERLGALDTGASKVSDVARVLSDRRVDAVVIATPPGTHTELAVASFEAGKHVFVEKPMALCATDARRVLRAARLAQKRGMIGFVLHYHPAVEQLRQWIGRGLLGRVRHILSSRRGSHDGAGDAGQWWSLGPHDVSLACFLTGRDPRSITLADRVDDSAAGLEARLEFTGGCTAELCVAAGGVQKVRRLIVTGTRATALFDDTLADRKLVLFDLANGAANIVSDLAGRHPDAVPELPAVEPLRLEAAHFVNALSTGAPFRSDIVDGARVVEILEAGQESLAQGGRPVSLEPTRTGSKTAYPSRVTSR